VAALFYSDRNRLICDTLLLVLAISCYKISGRLLYLDVGPYIFPTKQDKQFMFELPTRSQAVARLADRTASQHLWGSRDVIGYVTIR